MTQHEIRVCNAILDYLHSLDGGQAEEIIIHARVNEALAFTVPLAEFHGCIAECDRMGWLTGVRNKITNRVKWNINDAGEAARLEMR